MTTSAQSPNAADDLLNYQISHMAALGWAFTHTPTQEAYKRSTGEDIAPALDRYRQWLEANVIGAPGEVADEEERAA